MHQVMMSLWNWWLKQTINYYLSLSLNTNDANPTINNLLRKRGSIKNENNINYVNYEVTLFIFSIVSNNAPWESHCQIEFLLIFL